MSLVSANNCQRTNIIALILSREYPTPTGCFSTFMSCLHMPLLPSPLQKHPLIGQHKIRQHQRFTLYLCNLSHLQYSLLDSGKRKSLQCWYTRRLDYRRFGLRRIRRCLKMEEQRCFKRTQKRTIANHTNLAFI